jgi:hypothetical protein
MASKVGENFCLKWKDFESNISTGFRELRDDKDFFDVTLACDDNQVQAHKVILSACSPFFRAILRKNPHPHPLLYLKGVKYEDIVSVLNFMYHGEVNVAQEELNTFLAVAEDLQVKGLTQTVQKLQTTSQHMPPANLSPYSQSVASNAMTNHDTPHKHTMAEHGTPHKHTMTDHDTPYKHTMTEHSTPHKQQRIRKSYDHVMTSHKADYGHESEVKYIDAYIPSFMKTEGPAVDVDCDPKLSSVHQLVQHKSDFPAEQGGGYEYQQGYQKMNVVYEEPAANVGDTSKGKLFANFSI